MPLYLSLRALESNSSGSYFFYDHLLICRCYLGRFSYIDSKGYKGMIV